MRFKRKNLFTVHEDHPKEAVFRNRQKCIKTVFEKMNFRNLTWGQMGKVQPPQKDIYSDLSVYNSLHILEHHPKEDVCQNRKNSIRQFLRK